MTVLLRFADPDEAADLRTFLTRAGRVQLPAVARVQALGGLVVVSVELLPGVGLMQTSCVLGMRAARLATPVRADRVVGLAGLADSLAGAESELPGEAPAGAWTALTPPRAGWVAEGDLPIAELRAVHNDGLIQVTRSAPPDAGAATRQAAREAVWGKMTSTDPAVPAGLAFGAGVLGFLTGPPARVHSHGRWWRLTTSAGYVLARPAA